MCPRVGRCAKAALNTAILAKSDEAFDTRGMRRYVRDPRLREFQEKVREEVQRIGKLADGPGYVVYAIRDPTRIDDRRRHEHGPPIYVGQSKQIAVRANAHMRDGGESYASSRCKAGLLKGVMKQWCVPWFEILDTAPTHLTSLIAETVWARRFVWLGYELANKWPEHRTKEVPRGLFSVPPKRLWSLTVGEAIEDQVSVRLVCQPCSHRQEIDLQGLRPETPLRNLRTLKLICPTCGSPLLRIARPDTDTWRWASYQPQPMPSRVDC